jgi:hypothetical protein
MTLIDSVVKIDKVFTKARMSVADQTISVVDYPKK